MVPSIASPSSTKSVSVGNFDHSCQPHCSLRVAFTCTRLAVPVSRESVPSIIFVIFLPFCLYRATSFCCPPISIKYPLSDISVRSSLSAIR